MGSLDSHLRVVGAVRFAIGVTLGLVFVAYQIVPEALWIPVTIAVVMSSGPYSGGVLNKALQRGVATAVGCGLGLAFILLRGPHSSATIFAVGAVGGFAAGYYLVDARYSYIVMYASVSLIIVVSIPPDAGVSFALWRVANIFIGGVIGLLVATLVLPNSARRRFLVEFDSTITLISGLISRQREGCFDSDEVLETEERIVAGLRSQKATLASARFESMKWRQAAAELGSIVDRERQLMRHLVGQTPDENSQQLTAINSDAASILGRHGLSQPAR